MQKIGIGLIGTGFMGKSHARAWRAAATLSGDIQPVLISVADIDAAAAESAAQQFGFMRWTQRWCYESVRMIKRNKGIGGNFREHAGLKNQ